MKRFLWFSLLLLFTACTPTTNTAVSPTPSPETAVLPTETVPPPVINETTTEVTVETAVPDPTQPAAPTATTAVTTAPTAETMATETGVTSGRTEEGAFFLGDPNAPIVHLDYSDFL